MYIYLDIWCCFTVYKGLQRECQEKFTDLDRTKKKGGVGHQQITVSRKFSIC